MMTDVEFYSSTVTLRREYKVMYDREGHLLDIRQLVYTLNYGPGGRWFCLEGDMSIDSLAERIFASNWPDTWAMRRVITDWH